MIEIAPYAFWDCQEGSGTTITSKGDHVIELDLVGGGTPFSRANWITLDGTNYFDKAMSTLSASELDFLSPDNGILIMWCQIYLESTDNYAPVVSQMTPLSIGANSNSEALCHHKINLPGGLNRARFRDGTNLFTDLGSGSDSGSTFDQEDVFGILCHNGTQKSGYFYRNRNPRNGVTHIADTGVELGAITFTGSSNERLRIGGSTTTGGALQFPYVSQLRNIGIMNLGNNITTGIDDYLQELFANDGVPTELR